jgi:hypothetical protein
MEFDARVKEPDKVGFDCKVTMPDGATVELKFRDFANIPGSISLNNPGDSESQLWGSFAWGLISPTSWPEDDDTMSALNLFRALPMNVVMKIHRAWQKQAGVSLGESSASKPSPKSTEKS